MKAASATEATTNGHTTPRARKPNRLRMTRRLAEKRAVGDASKPKFDGVALLRTLKK